MTTQYKALDQKQSRRAWVFLMFTTKHTTFRPHSEPGRKGFRKEWHAEQATHGYDEGKLVGHGVGMLNAMDGVEH